MGVFAVLVPLILLLAFPNVRSIASSDKTTSISIRLIHKYSPESPIYPGNLTFLEKWEMMANESEARASYLKSIISPNTEINSPPRLIKPYVMNKILLYAAEVRVGQPGRFFYFLLDTGADMSWVLCKYQQTFDPYRDLGFFNPYKSNTYTEVNCTDHGCDGKCVKGKCVYQVTYLDGLGAEGIFAKDEFGFKAAEETSITFKNILFVCADPKKTRHFPGNIRGILAMNPDPKSFTSQMAGYTNGRFSYCLVPPKADGETPMSYLKFNFDMGYIGPKVQTTKFLKLPGSIPMYFLNLVDISVNGKRLKYPPNAFLINPQEGFLIDSGSSISQLHKTVYWKLHNAFIEYFAKFNLKRRGFCPGGVRDKRGIQLCYFLPDSFTAFPSMTYHFSDADLQIAPEQTVMISRNSKIVMLAVALSDETNILGAYQQGNTRFTYDNRAGVNSLNFNPENCERDSSF
ncbi:hypothetical protein ACFE04_006837 [Oxalis oulophora]